MKYDIVKHKKFCKQNAPKFYDFLLLLFSGLMLCLCYDLNLMAFGAINFFVFLFQTMAILSWVVVVISLFIIAKHRHIDLKSINIEDNQDGTTSK